jgi:hypothetical protein
MAASESSSLAPAWVAVISLFEGVSLLALGLLHVAAERLGFGVGPIGPVLLVEAACGALLLVAALACSNGSSLAWPITLGAHLAAIAGVLVGIGGLAAAGSVAPENAVFHPFLLAVLLPTTVYLVTARGRRNLQPLT